MPRQAAPVRKFTASVVLAALAGGAVHAQQVPAAAAADQEWRLPTVTAPADNPTTAAKVDLGKALFFDPRLSGNGSISCATCHNPALGWSDGLKTGIGINGTVLGRATPTIVNVGVNTQFMWDGRKKSLEDQALGPMQAAVEMHTDFAATLKMLRASDGYRAMFSRAFPGEPVDEKTLAKAIAAFERTVTSKDSPFDRWLAGNRNAITPAAYRGYQIFKDPARGNCNVCHSGGNFTDNGFHNIGIAKPEGQFDEGRFAVRALPSLKGAMKTPTLRDIELTAPYFHDGSAATLMDVVEHYARGGDDKRFLSKDVRVLDLSRQDKEDLVAFMRALTGQQQHVALPVLPPVNAPSMDSTPVRTAARSEK